MSVTGGAAPGWIRARTRGHGARNVAEADDDGFGPVGGELYRQGSAAIEVRNGLVALNLSGPQANDRAGDPITSLGHNLISTTDGGRQGFSGPGDLVAANPRLGPLERNGGRPRRSRSGRAARRSARHTSGAPRSATSAGASGAASRTSGVRAGRVAAILHVTRSHRIMHNEYGGTFGGFGQRRRTAGRSLAAFTLALA